MATGFLRVKGDTIVDGNGEGVVMRGAALGGWMKYADDQILCYSPVSKLTYHLEVWRTSSQASQATKPSTAQPCAES